MLGLIFICCLGFCSVHLIPVFPIDMELTNYFHCFSNDSYNYYTVNFKKYKVYPYLNLFPKYEDLGLLSKYFLKEVFPCTRQTWACAAPRC